MIHIWNSTSKDSIGAAELGVGHPCIAQGQFKSCKGAKRSPLQGCRKDVRRMSEGCRKGVARVSQGCRKDVARMLQGGRKLDLFAPLRLLNCPCAVQAWPTPKFGCANRILRQVKFQICITLLRRRASETCRNQNTLIPTFLGHWSLDPPPGSGSWKPD